MAWKRGRKVTGIVLFVVVAVNWVATLHTQALALAPSLAIYRQAITVSGGLALASVLVAWLWDPGMPRWLFLVAMWLVPTGVAAAATSQWGGRAGVYTLAATGAILLTALANKNFLRLVRRLDAGGWIPRLPPLRKRTATNNK